MNPATGNEIAPTWTWQWCLGLEACLPHTLSCSKSAAGYTRFPVPNGCSMLQGPEPRGKMRGSKKTTTVAAPHILYQALESVVMQGSQISLRIMHAHLTQVA
jgi:hypothetical protein